MFVVVPWPTPTRATTDATPMITPSIVSAARSRLVPEARQGEAEELERVHAAICPSRRWIWRSAAAATSGSWVISTIVRPAAWSSRRSGQDVGAGRAVEVAGRLVGEDQGGIGDERPGDRDALLLAAGQLGRLVVEPVAEARAARGPPWPAARARAAPTPW